MDLWSLYYFVAYASLAIAWFFIARWFIRLFTSKKATNLVELYLDSLDAYLYHEDDEAAAGAILIFNIFSKDDREEVFKHTKKYIDDIMNNKSSITDEVSGRCLNVIDELSSINNRKIANLIEIGLMKNEVARIYPDLVRAINKYDSSYFARKKQTTIQS
jgi:hypothetical protein